MDARVRMRRGIERALPVVAVNIIVCVVVFVVVRFVFHSVVWSSSWSAWSSWFSWCLYPFLVSVFFVVGFRHAAFGQLEFEHLAATHGTNLLSKRSFESGGKV